MKTDWVKALVWMIIVISCVCGWIALLKGGL